MHRQTVVCSVGVLLLACWAQAQSDDLRRTLEARFRELYGDSAPGEMTFVKPGAGQSGAAAGGAAAGGRGAAGAGAAASGKQSGSIDYASKKGDSATGIVIHERGNELYLDGSPCNKRVVTFVQPYRRSESGTVKCGDREHPQVRVVQE